MDPYTKFVWLVGYNNTNLMDIVYELISLFYGISSSVCNLMPKPSQKDSSYTI